ncbi:MAG TPA: ribbon-helix-helix domain-containing protein [Kiritimatiellia bacterium]|jgi:metal-responsive CopG/Arc/MetJ family transcriptional regulator|nr:ribbon-helix-helix domain-containing protein [Kiritimatiellia bacterium]
MKVKTSITLDKEILNAVNEQAAQYGSRSEFLEIAARRFLAEHAKEERDRRDLDIINRKADRINREAEDVLDYQEAL